MKTPNRMPNHPLAAAMLAIALAFPGSGALAADTDATPLMNMSNPDYNAGKKAVEAKDWAVAVAAFERAVKRDPRHADAWNMLGYSYRWQNRMDESLAAYGKALALDPKHKGAHEYIGVAYLKLKQPDKAKEHLARLDAICGKDCEEYKDLAKAIADYK